MAARTRVPIRPVYLVDSAPPVRTRTRGHFCRDNWSTPRTLANWVRVSRDSWSTSHQLGPGTEWAGIVVQPHFSSDMGTSRLGELVDPALARTRDQLGWDSWKTPRQLGLWSESSETAGQPHDIKDPAPSGPGYLVDPGAARTRDESTAPQTRAKTGGTAGRSRGPSDPGSNSAHILGRPRPPRTHGPRADSARTTVRPRGPSQKGQSRPGQLFNPTSAWTLVRVGRESWLAPCNLGPGTEWAGIAGRPHST